MFPLSGLLDFKVDADLYRVAIGVVELVCGAMLAIIPGRLVLSCVHRCLS